MHAQKAIIIGSGVAGLAAATRLAVQGYEVTVFEANASPGGKLSMFEKDGFRFDEGPSLFTQPENIEALFNHADEPLKDYFEYRKVDIACKYFFENGKILNAFSDKELFSREMENVALEKIETVSDYLRKSEKLYKNIGRVFLNFSLHKSSTWFNRRIWKALGSLKLSYVFSTLNRFNRSKFSSPEAIQLFNRYATYNGSNPFKAPGMLSVIPHLEYNEGVFYPSGGMISISNALYNLAIKKGVQFKFNQPVQRIIQQEGKVFGVVAGDVNYFASVVISNADVYFTYKNLLNQLPKAKEILKQERSSSALIFYWGVKKQFSQLELHNILFSDNYPEEFNALFKTHTLYNDPTIYINITSKMEDGHAPHGKENWFVMVNAPTNNGQDWTKIKQQVRVQVIEKINRLLNTDIEALIETEEIMDPVLIESKTGSYMGSLYGTSSNSIMAAFFRHPNFSRSIKGLYFCGGSVHPGGGIPLCFKSAKIVADLVAAESRKSSH